MSQQQPHPCYLILVFGCLTMIVLLVFVGCIGTLFIGPAFLPTYSERHH